jgi:hypothetical protein
MNLPAAAAAAAAAAWSVFVAVRGGLKATHRASRASSSGVVGPLRGDATASLLVTFLHQENKTAIKQFTTCSLSQMTAIPKLAVPGQQNGCAS